MPSVGRSLRPRAKQFQREGQQLQLNEFCNRAGFHKYIHSINVQVGMECSGDVRENKSIGVRSFSRRDKAIRSYFWAWSICSREGGRSGIHVVYMTNGWGGQCYTMCAAAAEINPSMRRQTPVHISRPALYFWIRREGDREYILYT